ncbi:MAG: YjbF family lipoprotein [Rhizomicrobium sp.]
MPTRLSTCDPRRTFRPSRRALFAALAAAPVLARCSSASNSAAGPLAALFSGRSVPLKEVQDTPFASLGLRIGAGDQTMLVLATRIGSSDVWTSASQIALEIASGRILRTAGLPQNLSGTRFSGADPLAAGLDRLRQAIKDPHAVDFEDRNAHGVAIESVLAPAGVEDIDVLGTRVRCLHAVEQCRAPALSWTFTNQYWASAESGLVWRSLQNVHPALPALEIVLFRPPK